MTVFWIFAGLLIAGALLFVLPPLLGRRALSGGASHGEANINIYRDQLRELDEDLAQGTIDREHYDLARREIERRVIEEGIDLGDAPAPAQAQWTLVSITGVLLPVIAVGIYLAVGTPEALKDPSPSAQQAEGGHAVSQEQIEAMVTGLAERLKQNPEDGDGWLMLAKSYGAMGRFVEAGRAYGEAVRRLPPNAQLLADYADALAMAQGRALAGEPEKLIEQALKVDPDNVKALALSGTVAFSKKDYRAAATAWRRILALVPPESDLAQRIQSSVAEAEALSSGKGGAAPSATNAASGDTGVKGRVTLSAEASKKVSPGDTVFIFARAAQGPRMPVAIFRTQVGSLPMDFQLDDSMSLMDNRRLSEVGDLVIGARVSKSGTATPAAGDWESALVPAKPGVSGLKLSIDRPHAG